jgi:dipeptidase E
MNAARFADAAATRIQTNGLTYAGYSAGACVTGPDLEGIHLMDDPAVIPEGYDPSIPTDTLGWIPLRIVPHWRSDHPEAPAAEIASSYMEQQGLAHRTIRDGQVVVINQG